jgi:soluble lytic murein transglycosylase-like protein
MRATFISALAISIALLAPPVAAQPARTQAARTQAPAPALPPMAGGLQCRAAILAAERAAALPPQLMAAIARVESGRVDAQGIVHPWPWTINAEGAGQYFDSKEAAIAAVRALQARGVQSIDVGCMQVNLAHHPQAFASLDQAFDPAANAAYAARFLNDLYATTRDWTRATAFYHSQTPERGELYQKRVAAVWPEEQKRLGITPGLPGHAFSRHAFSTNAWNSTAGPRTGVLAQSGRPQPAQVPPRRVATVAPGTGTRM